MSDDNKILFAWFALAVVVIVAVGVTALRERGVFGSPQETLCDNTRPPKSHTVFLLDFSDNVTDEVAESIKINLRENQNSSEDGGQLTLLRITTDSYVEDQKICKPPLPLVRNKKWNCTKDLKGIDKYREKEAKRYCEFSDNADTTIEKIKDQAKESLPSSPLIESLAAISVRSDFTSNIPRKIVLYSDLLQNTNKYSFYSGRGPQPDVETVMRDDTIDLSNLSGAEIEVQHIQRPQSAEVKNFWRNLFEKLMVESTSIIPLHDTPQQ